MNPNKKKTSGLGLARIVSNGIAGVVICGCLLYWQRLQSGQIVWSMSSIVFYVITTAGIILMFIGREALIRIGVSLLFVMTMIRIAGFYSFWMDEPGKYIAERTLCMTDRIALAVSVVVVLIYFLNTFFKQYASRSRSSVKYGLYGAACILILALSFDVFYFNETAERHYFRKYHPYFTYGQDVDPEAYVYAHAHERFVKDMRHYTFSQEKPSDTVRIILSGASTMWGHFQSDSECLARVLERKLEQKYSEKRVEVITVAYPGKYQLNELIDLSVIVPHWDPDIVISFNGFNEISWYDGVSGYEGMPYVDSQLEVSLDVTPWQYLAYHYSNFGLYSWSRRLASCNDVYRKKVREVNEYEEPRFYSYLASSARVLKAHAIPYVFSFCPTVYEKRMPTAEEIELASDDYKRGKIFERHEKADNIIAQEGEIVYNAVSVFDDVDGTIFLDECHVNNRGVELMAEDLATRIPEWLKKQEQ